MKEPEKTKIVGDPLSPVGHDFDEGYNQAIDDFNKWIDEAPIEMVILNVQEEIEDKSQDIELLQSHRKLIAEAIRRLLKGEE